MLSERFDAVALARPQCDSAEEKIEKETMATAAVAMMTRKSLSMHQALLMHKSKLRSIHSGHLLMRWAGKQALEGGINEGETKC